MVTYPQTSPFAASITYIGLVNMPHTRFVKRLFHSDFGRWLAWCKPESWQQSLQHPCLGQTQRPFPPSHQGVKVITRLWAMSTIYFLRVWGHNIVLITGHHYLLQASIQCHIISVMLPIVTGFSQSENVHNTFDDPVWRMYCFLTEHHLFIKTSMTWGLKKGFVIWHIIIS